MPRENLPDARSKPDLDQEHLKRLAHFAAIFRNSKTRFGKWHPMTGKGTMEDPLTNPWFEQSKVANEFTHMLYDSGWIRQDFNWTEWVHTPEGERLCADRAEIGRADCEQLAKVLTALVRGDRFSEGLLATAYSDKRLLSIVERAEALLAEMNSDRTNDQVGN
jgi:hypothetical protein